MKVLFLPTDDACVKDVQARLSRLGHSSVQTLDKEVFFKELRDSTVVLALGNLTPLGIWLWGYARARGKKVRAIHGVSPCFTGITYNLNKWLDEIPQQQTLF